MSYQIRSKMVLAVGAMLFAGAALAQVKIAYIDPLSGMMAATGDHGLREFQFAAAQINAHGGVLGQKLEIIGMDNKLSPQESLQQLNRAIDQGVRYITQGNGSSVAGALIDALNKHNARDPKKSVLFLNYAAVDPDFTNSKCSFWHFRFDANSDMKLEAITNVMAKDPSIKKVYIIGQDYSFGQQVSKTAKVMLAKKMPNVKIVGDELHPLARVKDFSPYIAKIKASGADSVITGNWGSDLALLIKAAKDAGLTAKFYTFYAGVVGAPTALGEAGVGRVKVVSYYSANMAPPKTQQYIRNFKKKYGPDEDPYTQAAVVELNMLVKAMTEAKSTEPIKVARALEGMHYDGPFGDVYMRAADHQLIQPLFIDTFAKVDGKAVKFSADGTSKYGFKNDVKLDGAFTSQPTNCQMQRP
ncbi:MAG TPA: branched-chain amino acid ABC transporter substrate-binding protein [Rhodocyclaceae bacterium]|nr:branched-chain amino acid ABC transporter substrate-binding protein [Rhodocyclaceae bacterium]